MTFKEKAILALNDAIYAKKKLTKKQQEELIILREEIRRQKTKKGLLGVLKKIGKIFGINLGDEDD